MGWMMDGWSRTIIEGGAAERDKYACAAVWRNIKVI